MIKEFNSAFHFILYTFYFLLPPWDELVESQIKSPNQTAEAFNDVYEFLVLANSQCACSQFACYSNEIKS